MFEIINNISEKLNHQTKIISLINESEELIIASPFLMNSFEKFFKKTDLTNVKKIRLISTLEPNSFDQLKK